VLDIGELFENLDDFEHRSIFDNFKNLWDPLLRIENYLSDFFGNLNKKSLIKGKVSKKANLIGQEIFIDERAVIEDGVTIHAPAVIGKNTLLRQGAYLRGSVIVGRDCVVGHTTEMKNSLLMDKSKVPHFNYVGDSIIGQGVNLGAGVILANFKSGSSDEKVYIHDKDRKINTNLRKLGSILGDNVHIGCNSVLNPGTIIGKNSTIYPLSSVFGVIPSNSIIKYKPILEIVKRK
jgi:NDP-sugar pyrophosphorylase family protein